MHGRGVAQSGSALAWGASGRWFKSSRPDQLIYEAMLPYILYKTASILIRVIPSPVSDCMATFIAFIFFLFRTGIRRNVDRNLAALCMKKTSRFAVFRNFSKAIVSFLKLPPGRSAALERLCTIYGTEHLDAALSAGRGAILVTPHVGPWEVSGARLASLGYRIHTVALEHPSGRVTRLFSSKRKSWGIKDYPPGECVGNLLKALRNREVVVLMIDREFVGGGIHLNFFGKDVRLPDGHIVLSMRAGAPLLPCVCHFTLRKTIEVRIDPPLAVPCPDDDPEMLGRLCIERIERYIREHYDQWFAFDHIWLRE